MFSHTMRLGAWLLTTKLFSFLQIIFVNIYVEMINNMTKAVVLKK